MSSRMAYRVGQAIGAVITFVLIAAYFLVGELRHMTADAHDHQLALWVYGDDAAPGDRLSGRVWLDENNARITGVDVWAPGEKVVIYGSAYGDWSHPSDTLDFQFTVPPDVAPDANLPLEIHIRSSAGDSYLQHNLHVYRKATALMRRIGKGALAVGYFVALTALFFALRRSYVRRGKEPSTIYLVPAVVIGIVAFVPVVEQVTRVHQWWFGMLTLVAWTGAFWIAERINRRIGLTRYELEPGTNTQVKAVEDLENAWIAAGLVVRRSGKDLVITKRPEFAIVSVPASDSFGAGAFTFRSSDPDLASAVIRTAEAVLGEL